MGIDRRSFIKASLAGSLGATVLPSVGCRPSDPKKNSNYAKIDETLKEPVFIREYFSSPVIIESLELLRYKNNPHFLCRVRSKNRAEGISVSHDMMRGLYNIFDVWLKDFFIGKDARDLDLIMYRIYVYQLNYRLSGAALGVPLATIEFAILDMMGKIANKPMGELFGEIHNKKIPVYQATEYRDKPVKESVELIKRDVEKNNTKALKIKVGGRRFWTEDLNASVQTGRTEKIIPLISKTFGDELALYADSNGYYSVEEAIRVGKMLQQYNFDFFEEPVQFYWYEETKQVANALSIPIAGGEQEFTLYGFRWLIANNGLQIVQPDNYYFGGMIRSTKVARMAAALGIECTPHMTGGGLGFLYMMHFASTLPNPTKHHEFKGFDTSIIFECNTSPLIIEEGSIEVPTGPGLGIEIDPKFIAKHNIIFS